MSDLPRLAITGSTGGIGGRVASLIAARGVAQRLIVRSAKAAPKLTLASTIEASDYSNTPAMKQALQGAETLFLVSGRECENRLEQHLGLVDTAAAAGVRRIVYLSFLGATPKASFTLARQHFATEQHIRQSGMQFTFLRSSLYADILPQLVGEDGVIRGPAGTGRVSWVSRDDIADVATAVLLDTGHDGKTYNNTGPEALSLDESAAVLTSLSGKRIRYQAETLEEAWASRRPCGAPDWEIEGWVTSYTAIAAGEMATLSSDVERVCGHSPQTLNTFLHANPKAWSHLSGA